MKSILTLATSCVLLYMNSFTFAQGAFITLEEAKKIKEGKVIVEQVGSAERSAALKKAMDAYWTFCSVEGYLPHDEAKQKAKDQEDVYLMSIRKVNVKSPTMQAYSSDLMSVSLVTEGWVIELDRGGLKTVAGSLIPAWDNAMSEEILCFAVSALQYQLEAVYKNEVKSNMKLQPIMKENSKDLKNKTLYLLKDWADPGKNQTPEQLAAEYSGKAKFVSYETWKNAIVSREEGIAYSIVVPVPMQGGYVYQHYIMDAQTGLIYGVAAPTVGVGVGGFNVTKKNSPDINDAIIKLIDDIYNGK